MDHFFRNHEREEDEEEQGVEDGEPAVGSFDLVEYGGGSVGIHDHGGCSERNHPQGDTANAIPEPPIHGGIVDPEIGEVEDKMAQPVVHFPDSSGPQQLDDLLLLLQHRDAQKCTAHDDVPLHHEQGVAFLLLLYV